MIKNTMKIIIILSFLLALSRGVKVVDDGKSVVEKSSSTKAPFEEVEHIAINVTLPTQSSTASSQEISSSQSTISGFSDSGVILGSKDIESEKSNVKPRKGVKFEPLNSTDTNSNKTNNSNDVVSDNKEDKLYKVNEHIPNDTVNEHPPELLNENTTILQSVVKIEPFPIRGEVTEITETPPKEKPKKPLHTVSAVDDPDIEKFASKPHPSNSESRPLSTSSHSVDEPVPAMSKERISDIEPDYNGYFGYIVISAVVLVFIAVPIVFGRKIKDYWNTRHYRRVDFLVDGMYND